MRTFIKKIAHPFLKFGLNWYYSKPRKFRYDTVFVTVHPDVFPPQLTFSTKILLDFIKDKELKNKSFLELGCGSGILSIYAAKKGGIVTSTDINNKALQYLERSASENKVDITVLKSDVFEKLHGKTFDCIIINPPYYPKNPTTIKEMAWFCGEHFEFFEKLFFELPDFITPQNEIFMILSEDCEMERIKAISSKNNINCILASEIDGLSEKNYIFQLQLS